jgi:hypothetical protein
MWMTAYGFDVLSALDCGLTVNSLKMKQVRAAFEEAGFELETKRVESIAHPNWDNASRSFRRFVFRLARSHTGRKGM